MEIPLRFYIDKKGCLRYTIPLWYRLLILAILSIVVFSILTAGGNPGTGAWIIIAVLLLGGLYEESWTADPSARQIRHRSGLVIAARSTVLGFDDIEHLSLTVLVRGTVPGSEDEKKENAAAFLVLAGQPDRSTDPGFVNRLFKKKAYINLVINMLDGTAYLIDTMPARRAASLREAGRRYAAACGKPFIEG